MASLRVHLEHLLQTRWQLAGVSGVSTHLTTFNKGIGSNGVLQAKLLHFCGQAISNTKHLKHGEVLLKFLADHAISKISVMPASITRKAHVAIRWKRSASTFLFSLSRSSQYVKCKWHKREWKDLRIFIRGSCKLSQRAFAVPKCVSSSSSAMLAENTSPPSHVGVL